MMGRSGGRRLSDVWKHATKLEGNRFRCKYCNEEFSGGATRIHSHISHSKNSGIRPCPRRPQGSPTLDKPMNHENVNVIVQDCFMSTEMEDMSLQHGRKKAGPFYVSKPFFDSKLDESDLQLIQYVFNMSLTQSDIVVSSSHFHLSRSEFFTLKPKSSLVSSVIDIFVDYLTDIERKSENTFKNWYLPLMFSTEALNDDKSSSSLWEFVKNQHIKENYMPNLENCEKIFIPVHIQRHYYLYVIHWKQLQEVQILDSLPQHINKEVREMTTEKLLLALDGLFEKELRGKRWAFKNFPLTNPEYILSQPNENDCGIFVINFMQQSANYKIPSFQYNSDEERLDLALKLLKSDQNKERERLYDVAKQQYAHNKDHDQEGSDLPGTKRKRVDDTCKEFSKDVGRGLDAEVGDSHRTFRNNVGMEKELNFVCKETMLCDSSLHLGIHMCPKLERPLQTEKMMRNGCTLRDDYRYFNYIPTRRR